MPREISTEQLQDLLDGDTPFALIDVREPGEYNSTHIPWSSLIPRRLLEFQMAESVPFKGVPVVLCDDDGRRAALAAKTVEAMDYPNVSILSGGINRWVSENQPTEWGSNVPSKDFGEMQEVVHGVPEIEATELHQWQQEGKKLVILTHAHPKSSNASASPAAEAYPEANWPYVSPTSPKTWTPTPPWWSTALAVPAVSSGLASCNAWDGTTP